ncbi:hypothetical protein AC578_4341 [Pseudocercospora eumusae]|uniref:F-box domain-containing protein n=1 Tax=Pseudocercospora eumusae TaxID=321146 RepID=A0A139H8B5_9PEZI|nr:hypothetical protein AC578_4341 [Pseudocercospora eumusae]
MTSFMDMPIELKLEIFYHLPAKDVQRVRRVCKTIQKAIDFEKPKLLSNICAREAARITADVKYLVDYDTKKVTFLEALRRWCKHRPASKEKIARMYDRSDFGRLYHKNKAIKDGLLKASADRLPMHPNDLLLLHPLFENSGELAHMLTNLHAYHHGPPDVKAVDAWLFASRENFVRWGQWSLFCLSDGSAPEIYDMFANTPFLEGEWRSQDEHIKAFEACIPLTTLKTRQFYYGRWKRKGCADARDRGRGVCDMSQFTSMFDVPTLPAEGRSAGIVAYCVKSKWARDSVERSLEKGQSLTLVEKAAIMDEMFLF